MPIMKLRKQRHREVCDLPHVTQLREQRCDWEPEVWRHSLHSDDMQQGCLAVSRKGL